MRRFHQPLLPARRTIAENWSDAIEELLEVCAGFQTARITHALGRHQNVRRRASLFGFARLELLPQHLAHVFAGPFGQAAEIREACRGWLARCFRHLGASRLRRHRE